MDSGKGYFKMLDELQANEREVNNNPVFKTKEIIEIKGSRFRIEKLSHNKMTLKLLKPSA